MGRQNSKSGKVLYRISLIEDDTHKNLLSLKFSKPGIIVVLSAAFILLIILIYSLIAFTPIKKSIPGYPDAHSKKTALTNAIKIDSLESAITRWELYAENLSRVLNEEPPVSYDSIIRSNTIKLLSDKPIDELSKQDSLLRESLIKEQQFHVSGNSQRSVPVEGMHFFPPIKGVITKEFDMVMHDGLDIKAPRNTVVYSIYEGSIIFSGWDDEKGNVIVVQHPDNVVSIYEHAESLLKKVGEKVKAGTPIALVGSTGSTKQDEYLHFSLWYNGEALDPTRYISF